MKPLNAAAVGLLAGVTAMWFGGEQLKSLLSGDDCGCPSPGASASSHEGHGHDSLAADIKCPMHFDGEDIVVDDMPGVQRSASRFATASSRCGPSSAARRRGTSSLLA